MADASLPDRRALTPAHTGGQQAPVRDFSAEYARREAIAQAEGFPSYWAKRKARSGDPTPIRRRRRRVA
jgi:hypothetical protein